MTRRSTIHRALVGSLAGVALVLSMGAEGGCSAADDGTTGKDTSAGRRTVTCHTRGDIHCWAYNVVYVEDHTDSKWPVDRYVAEWNRRLKLDLRYGKCRPNAGCAIIRTTKRNPNHGPIEELGETELRFLGDDIRASTTTLNSDTLDQGPKYVAYTVCHELGHVAGKINHNDENYDSCMTTTLASPEEDREDVDARLHPATTDVREINSIYR